MLKIISISIKSAAAIVSIAFVALLLLTGCTQDTVTANDLPVETAETAVSAKSTAITTETMADTTMTTKTPAAYSENSIIRYADLTHDGVDEKIVVDLADTDGISGDPSTVLVFAVHEDTETLLWYGMANTCHVGWNGYYLYQQDGQYYLFNWQPYICTGLAIFSYKVFSLSAAGKEIVLSNQCIGFSAGYDSHPDFAGTKEELLNFYNSASPYLTSSIVLIDTDRGNVVFSPQGRDVINIKYNRDWLQQYLDMIN